MKNRLVVGILFFIGSGVFSTLASVATFTGWAIWCFFMALAAGAASIFLIAEYLADVNWSS